MTASGTPLADILATTVYIDGANRPFGELTAEAIRARAAELRAAAGWGPTARVGPVAQAWREFSLILEQAGAASVGELDADVVLDFAPKLWIVPPGGALLSS